MICICSVVHRHVDGKYKVNKSFVEDNVMAPFISSYGDNELGSMDDDAH